MLQLTFLLLAVLNEGLYLSDFIGDLHHAQVGDLSCSINRNLLQVLPETYDNRVEGKRKQQLLLKVIVDLLNHEAMLVGHTLLEYKRTNVILYVLRVVLHA